MSYKCQKIENAMNKIPHACLILSLLVCMVACATIPSAQEVATANYGDLPTNLEETITAHLKETLKDPDSLKNLNPSLPQKLIFTSKLS